MANPITFPLHEKFLRKNTLERITELIIFFLLLTLLIYRLRFFQAQGFIWLLAFLCESWFTFNWILIMNAKWNPLVFKTFPSRLSPRINELPPVDLFVTTADPVLEPPIITVNTVLSLLALDYPANKLACYVSDDAASPVTFYSLVEAIEFAQLWVPFCKKYNIQIRAPFQYFSTIDFEAQTDVSSEFQMDSIRLQDEYSQLCRKIEAAEQNSSSFDLTSEFSAFSKIERRNHQTIVKVVWENKDNLSNGVPHLVYVSREKRPKYPHHYKAGAMNVLTRVSGVMTNSPFMLNVDCDMFANNPEIVLHAMCLLLGSDNERVAFVQCPQHFYGRLKDDPFGNGLVVIQEYVGRGIGGIQGPFYGGTGCFHRRKVIYGLSPGETKGQGQSFSTASDEALKLKFGRSSQLVKSASQTLLDLGENLNCPSYISSSVKVATQVADCSYESNTLWGTKEVHLWKVRCALSNVVSWWRCMKSKTDPNFVTVTDIISATPFGSFFNCNLGQNDQALLFGIVERWWPTTHTFHFPWGELGITPLDFTMLTGIPIGYGDAVPFDETLEVFTTAMSFFECFDLVEDDEQDEFLRLSAEQFKGGAINMSWFTARYLNRLKEKPKDYHIGEESIHEYVRAFLFYFVGAVLFGYADSYLRIGWMAAVSDVERMWDYDWGQSILAYLYRWLDLAVETKAAKGNLCGFVWIIPYWWYEHFRVMHPVLKRLEEDETHDLIPRIQAWGLHRRQRGYGDLSHNIHNTRQQIELLGASRIEWQPWAESFIFQTPYADIPDVPENTEYRRLSYMCHRARFLSQRRMILIGSVTAWYLGDRCWRQVSGEIVIPYPPPMDMTASDILPAVLSHYRANPNEWPDASAFSFTGDYDLYWKRVGRGLLLGALYRGTNFEGVTSGALRPDIHFPGGVELPQSQPRVFHDIQMPQRTPQIFDDDDLWHWSMITSQGQDMRIPIPPVDAAVVADLSVQFEQLAEDEVRSELLNYSSLTYAMRESFMESSRRSFEYLQEERNRTLELQRRVQELENAGSGVPQAQAQPERRQRRRGESSSTEPSRRGRRSQ